VGTGETRLRPNSETARNADRGVDLGAPNPISGLPDEMGESGAGVGGGHSSGEGVDNRTRRSEGPLAECAAQRRGSGIAVRLFTRRTTSPRDGCWDVGPTPVAGRNAARRLLGGEPCAGESHARFGEGGLETEPPRPPRQPSTLLRRRECRLPSANWVDASAGCAAQRRLSGPMCRLRNILLKAGSDLVRELGGRLLARRRDHR
jgi:hypothetical protein